jgi:BASS family bile acid:Na+ symporter
MIRLFPWLLLITATIGFLYPPSFIWLKGSYIPFVLGLVMIGMGIHLQPKDFRILLQSPRLVVLGCLLQYSIMPVTGWAITKLLGLEDNFSIGLILVASCPGGTASNVIVYLARGHLALSVVLTSISTFLAVGLTPLIVSFLVGSSIDVPTKGLFFSTVQVILLPVSIGIAWKYWFPGSSQKMGKISGPVSVIGICLIVASIIGSSREILIQKGGLVILACLCLHFLGFLLGYWISRYLFGMDESISRTISVEVGMQNSGLGAVLAKENFLSPEVAVPSAISSLVHSILGSILAGFWRNRSEFPVDDTGSN